MTVHRLISDSIPLTLTTRIELDIAGKNREVLLGKALLPGFAPLALQSDLPARVEAEGRLLVQARPGRWIIELTARHDGPVNELSLTKADGPWAREEVWVFEAHNELRLVELENVTSIDPQQTTLPEAWKSFPAYRLRPGDTLRMVEKKRGDPEPAPDQLSLQRTWWLDFDGGGYTAQDQIGGTLNRSWRMEMNLPLRLGRVAIDGQEQFITALGEGKRTSVEVRRGAVQLSADSRVEGYHATLPAVGWEQDFHQVSGVLNLPPGWRLLHARGVDQIETWFTQWSLLDIFLVLIIALGVGKLWGWRWGGVALLTLLLIYHEFGAPRRVWLNILAAVALLRVLPPGRARMVVEWYRRAGLIVLVIIALPFMVTQLRQGLFPTLEMPWQVIGESPLVPLDEMASPVAEQGQADMMQQEERLAESPVISMAPSSAPLPEMAADIDAGNITVREKQLPLDEYDPKAKIQTGPGLPQWQWRTVTMNWGGPVQRDQEIRLWLLSPTANLVLSFMRVALLILLALVIIGITFQRGAAGPGGFAKWTRPAPALALILLAGMTWLTPFPAHAGLPSPELLKELQQRLLPPPDCLPECAAIPRLALEVSGTQLRARLEIHVAEATAVPLPGQAQQWSAQQVWVNGLAAPALSRSAEGYLWLQLGKGTHQVLMEGALPARESVQLALPLKPHRVEVLQAEGWEVAGIHDDGLADDNLQLTRKADVGGAPDTDFAETAVLPPFVRIERTLLLGLTWQVETRVTRLSPPGSAVLLQVPLLNGESVVTPGVRVAEGKVMVNLAPLQNDARWSSVLSQQDELALLVPENVPWVEVWRADISPIWHVDLLGIPIIHHQDAAGRRLPEWRPWPGESISIRVTRPAGVPGQTLTLERSVIDVTPGLRATDVVLTLNLRSSQGGQHDITLPSGAELQDVSINGQSQPIRQKGANVTLPLTPGTQEARLTWREPRGITTRFATPLINTGSASVNAHSRINVPGDRWILFLGGPSLGPAILFWGVLLVIVLVAIGLGRVRWTPLKTRHWFLLAIGLSQVPIVVGLMIVGWLFALGWRERYPLAEDTGISNRLFNLRQTALALWTLLALAGLFYAVQEGLLGQPDMQIIGNGSDSHLLRWYQDRSDAELPQAWLLSVPLIAYRILMLAWALWLAFALLHWLRWGWNSFSTGGMWRAAKTSKIATKITPSPS